MAYSHRTVLLEPAIDALLSPAFGRRSAVPAAEAPPLDGVYVDGTFGRGGHSRLLLSRLAPRARLLVFDKDPAAIAEAQALRAADGRVEIVHDGFATLGAQLDRLGIDRVPQIDEAERGFSFMRDGPLDMRMDTSRGQTAAQWLAEADQEQIKEVIADYGEERFAFQIAKAIVARRQSGPLRTTGELAQLVAGAVRTREKGQHPATRTFQAVRIHINEELAQLAHALPAALTRLRARGRLAVISFHSLEDRMVKQCFAAAAHPGRDRARLPIPERDMPQPYVTLLGRVLADEAEVADNVRARSAVLRVAERTSTPLSPDEAAGFVRLPGRAPARGRAGRAAR